MQSIDTNILVRAIVREDPRQSEVADSILQGQCVVQITVTLEVFWVLRSRASMPVSLIATALKLLMSTDNVYFVHADEIEWALDRAVAGGDFADMLHVALSKDAKRFVTFDRAIARHAADGPVPVETL